MKTINAFFAHCLVSVVLCLLSLIRLSAQSGTWIWMNGTNTANSQGNYGAQGFPDVANSPPALYQAVQWTDKQGNFWIFGGVDSDQHEYSDLWEYIPGANTWTWVNGPGICLQPGVYGTLGVPSPNNVPGARGWGCASWTDSVGDLWLFGGLGYDSLNLSGNLNDLWSYNIASNEWTWRAGPPIAGKPGVYGNLYQASASFVPPGRSEANTAWVDGNNNLWLFGGYGFIIGSGCFNDIWRYSIASDEWAWMGGTKSVNAPGNYGSLGVESPGNIPPARSSYVHWVDSNYLYFACGGTLPLGPPQYNDFWRFNINTNYFTWIGGDTGNVPAGQYTHYCSTAYGDKPPGLIESRAVQSIGCTPVLFMWGGGDDSGSYVDDLWGFDLRRHQWRWLSGYDSSVTYGNFGVQGVSSPNNMPPGTMGVCFWGDNSGNLWVWGGQSAIGLPPDYNTRFLNTLNGMWEYIPDPSCFPPDTNGTLNITASNPNICPGDSVQLCAPPGFSTYAWNNGDTASCISVNVEGSYYFVASSNVNCHAASDTVGVGVYYPSPITVSVNGDTLTGYFENSYQWLLNDTVIPGATSRIYIAPVSGSYSLQVTDTGGCEVTSTPVFVTGITDVLADNSITVFPNPTTGSWQLSVGNELIGSIAEVFDATGRIVFKSQIANRKSQVAIPREAAGVYQLRISGPGYSVVRKLVKM